MYRVLIGLGSLLLVTVWGGVALVHAGPSTGPDFVVEGIITEPDGSAGVFTLTNNTTQFSIKAFAVSHDPFIFLLAGTNARGWTAETTDTSPIPGLPGTGGGTNPVPLEYAVYTACDRTGDCGPLLGPGTAECFDSEDGQTQIPCFIFSLSQPNLPSLYLGIIAVDNTTGEEVTCIGRTGPAGCNLSSNEPSRCDLAVASQAQLWPPNHKLIPISIVGVTDPYNDAVTITVTEVTQDEPVNGPGDGNTSPDAVLQGATVLLRAERAGSGNGRVYQVVFTADDQTSGESCEGTVRVEVPPSRGRGVVVVDDGQYYISTQR